MTLEEISAYCRKKPIFILRLDYAEYESLQSTVMAMTEFTVAVNHAVLEGVKTPCVALILAKNMKEADDIYVGVIKSKSAVTTLETRLSIRRVGPIELPLGQVLVEQIECNRFKGLLQKRLDDQSRGVRLSSALSAEIIHALSKDEKNKSSLLNLSEQLKGTDQYSGISGLQEDAVHTALRIFGFRTDSIADALELRDNPKTVLSGIRIREDAVIEHDARTMPNMSMVESYVTGKAIFSDSYRTLEVITANKRPLEEVLGVDLIYINRTLNNVVMVQYKMLEREGSGEKTRWLYRPDKQLKKELQRMKALLLPSDTTEDDSFRLNSQAFYIKFVKRDSIQASASITIPLDHFEDILKNPLNRGKRAGLLVDYRSLNGRYLRSRIFIELVQCGYIGTHDKYLKAWSTLIDLLLEENRAVVTAIQDEIRY